MKEDSGGFLVEGGGDPDDPCINNASVRNQKTVTDYFSSKQLLLFGFEL